MTSNRLQKTAVIGLCMGLSMTLSGLALSPGVSSKPETGAASVASRPSAMKSGTVAYFRSVNADVYMTARFTDLGVEVRCETADGKQTVSFVGILESQPGTPEAYGGESQCLEPGHGIRVEYAFSEEGSLVATRWKGAGPSELFGLAWYRVAEKGSAKAYQFPEWKGKERGRP